MAKTKQPKKRTTAKHPRENFDGVYLFKLVFYLLVGSMWLKATSGADIKFDIPIGLMIGLVFASHEHFRTDRKIEYAVMLVAMLVGYFAPFGLYIGF